MKQKYSRTPEEMISKERRQPISARVKESTLDYLTKEASKVDLSLSSLVEQVLDDYAEWLKEQRKKR